MSLSAGEQYLLELINRARLDPGAEADRYDLGLNAGLNNGTISGDTLQVLAPSTALETAATSHSNWMLSTDSFSHTGAQGSSAGDRVQDNGYAFKGTWAWRENLAWVGSTGTVDMEAAISEHHEGLYRSESHRVNTFATNMSEIGIGQVAGRFDYSGTSYNSSMLTLNYAKSGTEVFVTGVAYTDKDNDLFYSIGEGDSGVWINAEGSRTTTAAAGGYGIGLTGVDLANVRIGEGGKTFGTLEVDLTDGNAKVDLLTKDNGAQWVMLSSSADLGNGLKNARLLGGNDLELTGSGAGNFLIGNDGDNRIMAHRGNDTVIGGDGDDTIRGHGGSDDLFGGNGDDSIRGGRGVDDIQGGLGHDSLRGGGQNDLISGGNGSDTLRGGRGRDTLNGDDGNDYLDGQRGNDTLTGGNGRDTFVFSEGRDRITDFENDVDTIYVNGNLGADGTLTLADLMDMGEIQNGRAIFDFGGSDVLTIDGISNLNMLANDMIII